MDAGGVRFQELLNGNIQYRVPLFQRTYSWDEENWERLWEDLLEIYAMNTLRGHFLGAIVTLPIPDSPESCSKYMVIDGQQRLTTLFILLASIRDAAKLSPETEQLAQRIEEESLINKFASVPEEREKMRPTQQDRDAFVAVVSGKPFAGESRVVRARAFFTKELTKGDLEDNPIDLFRFKTCLTDYLDLVSIKLEQQDSPHRIFESLNNTGMALSASDLIRNHIFMQIPQESEQNRLYTDYWFPMQKRMELDSGSSSLSDFFWRYLMKDGDSPRYDEVFEGMRNRIDKQVEVGSNLEDVLKELDQFSEYYLNIWKPEPNEPSEDIKQQLLRLNQWEVDVAYPFLLNCLDKRHNEIIDDGELLEILRMIESFVVRRIICGIPTNRLRRAFGQMTDQISDENFVGSCKEYLMRNEWPTDKEFHEKFQTARVYIRSRLSRLRLILSSLESSFEHHEPIEITDQITIEHIMPQTLSPAWENALGERFGEIYDSLLHTIGNLTYSGYNSEMGNESFEEKKETLSQSHFELNRDIIEASEWTEGELRDRGERLAGCALNIWKRDTV